MWKLASTRRLPLEPSRFTCTDTRGPSLSARVCAATESRTCFQCAIADARSILAPPAEYWASCVPDAHALAPATSTAIADLTPSPVKRIAPLLRRGCCIQIGMQSFYAQEPAG